MKKTFLILILSMNLQAQKMWFNTYTDSIALVRDANQITKKFRGDVQKINPKMKFEIKTVLHTTPYLIYFYKDSANIPLWAQVIPEQQSFFAEIGGSETEGKRIFGLFFNGFYLPHELGHAYEFLVNGETNGSYQGEYFANTVAILWWRKQKRHQDLKNCYESAKIIWSKLPNPVPKDQSIEEYYSKNYEQASQNPYVYGYMQFKQFIEIYENKNLPDFDTFIKNFNKKSTIIPKTK